MDNILLGLSRFMTPIPRFIWKRQLPAKEKHLTASIGFMSPEHRAVRAYAVEGLARLGRPLSSESIARGWACPRNG